MSFTNQTKHATSTTNQTPTPSIASPTWADMNFPWNQAEGTWAAPKTAYTKQTKHTTTLTNQPKN